MLFGKFVVHPIRLPRLSLLQNRRIQARLNKTMDQKILQNDSLDEQLLREGYVVVPFLSTEENDSLTAFFNKAHPQATEGMYATAHVQDIAFRMKMNDFIKQVFERPIAAYFQNCRSLGGSFIAKGKGERGTINPHQDWNIVDEDKFRSFNIWVPLVDLNPDNGAIMVLANSHTWLKTYRSANISSAYQKVSPLLWETLQPLYMKKGEALIYDHRLIHASGENFSDALRLAAVFGIIPQEAEMLYYHQADENTIEVFESSPDFFLYGNIFEGPKGLKTRTEIPYTQNWSEDELKAIVTGIPYKAPTQNISFWQRIWNFWN